MKLKLSVREVASLLDYLYAKGCLPADEENETMDKMVDYFKDSLLVCPKTESIGDLLTYYEKMRKIFE